MTTTINASTSSGLVNTADTSGILQLQTASTAALTIDASQNVGIGTTSPGAKFSLTSTGSTTADGVRLTFGSEARAHNIYSALPTGRDLTIAPYRALTINTGSGTAEGVLGLNAYEYTTFGTGSSYTERMRIDSSGNVGIGTTSPNIGGYGANSRILTVQGVSGSYAIAELSSNSANSDDVFVGRLDFSSDGQAANYKNVASIASALSGSTSTKFGANLQFYTRANNAGSGSPIERMRLDPNGNLLFNSGYGSVATAYGCRAWVNFNGTGTPSIRASGNVSSITDNGTGNYTINFTNALVDANYSVSGIASDVGGTGNRGLVSLYTGVTNPAAGSFRIFTFADTTQTDNAYIYVSVFR